MSDNGDIFKPGRRIRVLSIITLTLFAALGTRLFDLQIARHDYFKAVAESQRQRASELRPHRGIIYVSEGGAIGGEAENFPVATNERAWLAFAVPRDMENPNETAERLAPALKSFRDRQKARASAVLVETGQVKNKEGEGSKSDLGIGAQTYNEELAQLIDNLRVKFDQRTDPFEPILRPYEVLDDELLDFLEAEQLPGIIIEEQEVRVYPEKTLASHILGYVGYQDEGRVGRYGIEGFFENMLAGQFGFLANELDTGGRLIGVSRREFTPPANGADIVLSIDRVVQSIIEEELKEGVNRFGAERGSIIVMNPKTGAILGMATFPSFNPNYYYAISDARVQLNPVVSDIFEPGSILKPLIMASALEEKIIEPDTITHDAGPVKVANYTIDTFDGKHAGDITMTQILEQSNNIGMVWVGQQLGAENIYDYLRRFGLGEKTGVQLEGETNTQLIPPTDWNVTTVATTSFGQGVAVTPIQALNAINIFANDGVLMKPWIVSEINHNGEIIKTEPQSIRQVVSAETANEVSAMMVSVIENGVAGLARVPGYYMAGKTGTAQVPDDRGRYSSDRKIISFVGFGPVEDPQFSILIKLDNPAGLSFASGTAAPMFKNLADKLLQYYQVPPSYDESIKQPKFQVSNRPAG